MIKGTDEPTDPREAKPSERDIGLAKLACNELWRGRPPATHPPDNCGTCAILLPLIATARAEGQKSGPPCYHHLADIARAEGERKGHATCDCGPSGHRYGDCPAYQAGREEERQRWQFTTVAQAEQRGREEERKRCCRDECTECSVGRLVYRRNTGEWRHEENPLKPGGILLPYGRCQAERIWERAYLAALILEEPKA